MVSATASSTSSIPAGNQISPVNEKLYKQSNLLGTWTGSFSQTKQKIEFKVLSIKGQTAQVEYKHNGQVQRGTATVDKNTLTFDNVTIATRDGSKGVVLFEAGNVKFNGTLTKDTTAAATAPANPLVGTWSGIDGKTGEAASFMIKSINGTDADVSYTIDGLTRKGTGSVYKNVISFGQAQITINPDQSGKVIYKKLGQTLSLAVKPASASTTGSTTSVFA